MSVSSPVPSLSARSTPADFLQGMAVLGRAMALIVRTPRLLGVSLLCGLFTLVALAGLLCLLWTQGPDLFGALWAKPEHAGARALWGIVLVLLGIVLFIVGAHVGIPLVLSPLQDLLSTLTEERCGGVPSPPSRPGDLLPDLMRGFTHTLVRAFFLLLGLTVLLPLHLVPGVGSLAWAVLSALWTIPWLAEEHLAAPMTRHRYRFSQVLHVLNQRWALCLGFGAGVYTLLWIPLLNSFFLPVAVVGGTLLYQGLLAAGGVPPPPGGK